LVSELDLVLLLVFLFRLILLLWLLFLSLGGLSRRSILLRQLYILSARQLIADFAAEDLTFLSFEVNFRKYLIQLFFFDLNFYSVCGCETVFRQLNLTLRDEVLVASLDQTLHTRV